MAQTHHAVVEFRPVGLAVFKAAGEQAFARAVQNTASPDPWRDDEAVAGQCEISRVESDKPENPGSEDCYPAVGRRR